MTVFLHPVLAQDNEDFDSIAKEQIKREAHTILDSYEKYGTLTETFTYLSKDYTNGFRLLFALDAIVLNDIGSPENREEYLTIDEYMSVIQKWYPEGLAIEFKNFNKEKNIGNPYAYNDRFAVRVNVNKEIRALTKEYERVDTMILTTIVIVFDEDLTEFKIKEINTQQPRNPEDILAQATKKQDKPIVQKSTKKEDKPIAQKSTKKEDKPIAQKSTKKEDKPIAQKSTKKEDKPIAQKSTKKEDKPIAQKSTKKEDKPIAQKSTKKEDKPIAQKSTKKEDKPIAQKSTKKEDKPIAQKSTKKQDKPIAQKTTKKQGKSIAKRPKKKGVKLKKKKPTLYKQVNRAEKGLFVGLSGGPYLSTTQFQLNNTWNTTFNVNGSSTNSPISPHFRLEADYFLTENLGLGLGLGYSTYKSNIHIDSLSIINYDVEESEGEIARSVTFGGGRVRENPDSESIDISVMLKYKNPIGDNLFLYGGVGPKFIFTNYRNFFRSARSLEHTRTYDIKDSPNVTTHGFVPQNDAEAQFLEEYNLFNENSYSETEDEQKNEDKEEAYSVKTTGDEFILKKIRVIGMANLGLAYSLDKRLKIKIGGVFTFGGNILKEEELSSPETILGLVEVLPDTGANVRNNYLSITNRTENQLNIRAVGIEIGLIYKIGNIDFFR